VPRVQSSPHAVCAQAMSPSMELRMPTGWVASRILTEPGSVSAPCAPALPPVALRTSTSVLTAKLTRLSLAVSTSRVSLPCSTGAALTCTGSSSTGSSTGALA
jgi:hypothetical protein